MLQEKNAFRILHANFLALILLLSFLGPKLNAHTLEAKADSLTLNAWFYKGWQYRKGHDILYTQADGAAKFYNFSSPRVTIVENPTDRHAFQPVHNTVIVECNVVVDGAVRKYLAYDSDPAGSQIRLYYTDDLDGPWTPYSGNPILSGYLRFRWPSVAYVGGVFHMFLTNRIDGTLERWTSTDGIHYSFVENIKVGGSQWKTPFIWFNSIDNNWYLYTHDATGNVEHVKVRSATLIEDLDLASDMVVVSVAAPFGAASVMYSNNTYWLVAEVLDRGKWKILAYYSTTSPFSGYSLVTNSPIITDDEACPILLLTPTKDYAYLYTNKDSYIWYQYTRKVFLNSTIFQAPTITNYQVKIKAHYGSGFDAGENVYLNLHSRLDFSDVRFTWLNSSSGLEQECSYWMEELSTGESATFWVKIPEISSMISNKIYIYYGKPDAVTTSNAIATFDLFDDFNENFTNWTIMHYDGTGSASIVNGWARINAQPGGDFWGYTDDASGIFKVAPVNDNYIIETKFRQQSYPTFGAYNRFLMSRTNLASDSAFYVMLFDDDSSHITTCWRESNGAYTEWAGENTGWSRNSQTTFYARLAKIGSTFYAYISPDGITWFLCGSRSGIYHGYIGLVDSIHDGFTEFDWIRVRKYVDPEPTHETWGSEEKAEVPPAPSISVSDISVNSTIAAKPCNFSAIFTAQNSYLSHYIFGTNNTGTWINETAVPFGEGKTQALVSIVKTLNSRVGTVVQWCIWANNTAGNWASTGMQSFLIRGEEEKYIIIDAASVSDERADVSSIQTVAFHARWSTNGSSVIQGSIHVNGTPYITNSTGWISLEVTSSNIGRQEWTVTAVDCGGVTDYIQTVPNPSIIWDQIKIMAGGKTRDSIMVGETVTIWFQAIYEYDSIVFDNTKGILYVNYSLMSWSAVNNRWEYRYTPKTPGTREFTVSNVLDDSYGLTKINDFVGTLTINVQTQTQQFPQFSITSNSTITELAFNSTSKTIIFTVTGPAGTIGYTNVTIAKTLIDDIIDLEISLDGNQIEYTAISTEYAWLIHFVYTHSTHKVIIILGALKTNSLSTRPITSIFSLNGILITITIILITGKKLATKKRHKT